MKEIIKNINENYSCGKKNDYGRLEAFDGILITTNLQKIELLISAEGQCCEHFGYFISHDDVKEFIDSELIKIETVDKALNVEKFNHEIEQYEFPNCMFVNITTNKGLLQFVAYNSHNGYYSHDALIISKGLNHSERL